MGETLRSRKQLLEAQSEASSEGMVIVSPDGKIVSWNTRFRELWGLADDGPMRPPRQPARPALEQALAEPEEFLGRFRALAEDADVTTSERVVLKDGRAFETYSAPVKDSEGGHYGRVWFFRDVTDQERVERRLAAQYAVTRVLSEAHTLSEAIEGVLATVCEALGWEVGAFWRLDHRANVLQCVHMWHMPSVDPAAFEAVSRKLRLAPGEGLPGRVWARGEPAWVTDVVHDPNFRRVPAATKEGLHGAVAFPVLLGGEVLGVTEFFSREVRPPDDELVPVMAGIGTQIGQFMERKRAEEGLRFLSSASAALAESLDVQATLENVTRLAVPTIADWCVVHMLGEDGAIVQLAPRHLDPSKIELVRELQRRYPADPDARHGHRAVLRTGRSELIPKIPDELLVAVAKDEEHLALLRALDLTSEMCVPLRVRGKTLGTLTLASAESRRRYGHAHLELAEELARRAAVAIEHARLFERERAARREAEAAQRRVAFLAEASAVLASSLDYEETLKQVARLAVPRVADWCLVYIGEADESIRRLAVEHVERKERVLAELGRPEFAIDPTATEGVPKVLRSGRPELVSEASAATISVDVYDRERFEQLVAADLEICSWMCVPLTARGRTFGAISFVSAESSRRYGAEDVALAEELSSRAALAVDNARLYHEAEQRAQAARALATVGDGVFLVDREGAVRLWNPAAEVITGLPAERVVGRRAEEAIPGWWEIVHLLPVAEGPRPGARPETVPLEIGGRELWLSFSVVRFSDGTVYAFRDLTDERRLEQLKTEFVATASHELRTPLAAVYGAAMTLRRADVELDAERRELLLSLIADESDRLARTVNDILWASRLDSGEVDVDFSAVDPRECARRVIESARAHLAGGIELELVAPDELPAIRADAQKLSQVLTNLVENAIKYSPDGGRVELCLEPGECALLISVRDRGLGIPEHERSRIFEKFYRLDPNLTRGVGGTGLGLYICRELVRRMRGRIWVASTEGRGSSFFVELPLAEPYPAPRADTVLRAR